MKGMDSKTLRESIIRLLSANRRNETPEICQSLTKRQIGNLIIEMLPPNSETTTIQRLTDRLDEQLETLINEFEVVGTGITRQSYCMAPPSVILSSEDPLQGQYVGDRAYMQLAKRILNSGNDNEASLVGSEMNASEARKLLEQVGISVQTEDMLFEAIPTPNLPTEVELSMAQQISLDEISGGVEIYVPKRADFLESRWTRLEQVAPHTQRQLYRTRVGSMANKGQTRMYFWQNQDIFYRLTVQQALLTMYRIDLDASAPRILDLNRDIPLRVTREMPRDYERLVLRYTVECEEQPMPVQNGKYNAYEGRTRRVRPRYRSLIRRLLEEKLGINRSFK